MFYQLQEGEKLIGTWMINYIPPNGGRYLGQLDVTDTNLYFDGKFDMSFSGMIQEALFVKKGSAGYLSIPRKVIHKVEAKRSFLKKKVMLTLTSGQVHTFDYGALNIDKLVEALEI